MIKHLLSLLAIAVPFSSVLAQGPQQLVSSTYVSGNDTVKTTYSYSKKNRVVKPITGKFIDAWAHIDETFITSTFLYHNSDSAYSVTNMGDTSLQVNTYDANHRLIKVEESINNKNYTVLSTLTYHPNGALDKNTITYLAKDNTSKYVKEDTYHDDGREIANKVIDSSGTWYVVYTRNYEYNASKQLTREYYVFDTVNTYGSSWGVSEYDYTYSAATAPYSVVRKSYDLDFDGTSWLPRTLSKTRYQDFDAQNREISDSSVSENSTSIDAEKTTYDGNFITRKKYYYNGNTLTRNSLSIEEFNNAGYILQRRNWNSLDTLNVPLNNRTYTYDAQGLMTAYTNVDYNSNTGYKTVDSILSTFNASNNLVMMLDQLYNSSITCEYQAAQGEDDPTSVEQLTNFAAKVYPNPVQGVLNLAIDLADYDVVLYNASGVLLGHFNNATSLDFTNRPTGSYIINVIDNKTGAAVAKTIIKN